MSDSLRPHGLLPCPLLPPSWHKFMSIESVMPSYHLSLCHSLPFLPSVFPTSRSFPMNWPFASGGQSIGASASASVLPMNIQGWLPLWLTDLISLLSKWLSRVFSSTTVLKHQFFMDHLSHWHKTWSLKKANITKELMLSPLKLCQFLVSSPMSPEGENI